MVGRVENPVAGNPVLAIDLLSIQDIRKCDSAEPQPCAQEPVSSGEYFGGFAELFISEHTLHLPQSRTEQININLNSKACRGGLALARSPRKGL